VAQPLALGGEQGLFLLAGSGVLDLLQLPLEQVELPVARPGARAELVERAQPRSRAYASANARRRRRARPAEAVEDVQLREASVSLRCSCWP
jgi:hypothetical protein